MGIFSRRDRIVDLTEDYKYEKKHPKEVLETSSSGAVPTQNQEASQGGFFNFFGNSSASSSPSSSSGIQSSPDSGTNTSETLDAGEKRRRLAKRLKDMTDRIEEQSNLIYLLQQRIELLEKKTNMKKYE